MLNIKIKDTIRGSFYLIVATIIWGFSFVVVKVSVERIPIDFLLAMRYTIAILFMLPLFHKKISIINYKVMIRGGVLGFVLFASQYIQIVGCKYTTAGKNAFITTVYVIIVPFLYWIIYKKRPEINCTLAAIIAMVSIGLFSLQGNFIVNIGDFLTLIAGFGLSIHIVFIDRFTQNHDPILLAMLQFIFASIFSWLSIFLFQKPFPLQILSINILEKMFYLGVFSTMLAFLLQIVGQKYMRPNIASILLSMEAVFGMIFSIILLNERLTARTLVGCLLMLIALILAQSKWSKKNKSSNHQ